MMKPRFEDCYGCCGVDYGCGVYVGQVELGLLPKDGFCHYHHVLSHDLDKLIHEEETGVKQCLTFPQLRRLLSDEGEAELERVAKECENAYSCNFKRFW